MSLGFSEGNGGGAEEVASQMTITLPFSPLSSSPTLTLPSPTLAQLL